MKKGLLTFLQILSLAVFCVSSFALGRHFWMRRREQQLYESLAEQMAQAPQPAPETGGEADESGEPQILPSLQPLFEQNPDLIGWLQIEDTLLSYPVMHTPSQPEYYLRRDFQKEYAVSGCPFLEERCDPFAPSDNLVIYGHHMKDGTMFGALMGYTDEAFFRQHPTIQFTTLYEVRTYEVIAAFRTVVYTGDPAEFKYFNFLETESAEEFASFVERCKSLTPYDIPATAQLGDQLLTLSTCEYSQENGRMVVVARRCDTD